MTQINRVTARLRYLYHTKIYCMDTITQNLNKKGIANKLVNNYEVALIMHILKMADEHYISHIINQVDEEFRKTKPDFKTCDILAQLRTGIAKANLNTDKKTFLLFLSSMDEKILYIDALLEEQIIVNEPFGIRDLTDLLQPKHQYLLLVQSADNFKVFMGGQNYLTKLRSSIPDNINAYRNDIANKTENFSDATDRKEIMLDKFIHHIDKELGMMLHQYPLPVFVMGPERMNGHFKKLSHNEKSVIAYIHGNFDESKIHQLLHHLEHHFADLWKLENDSLKNKIELALNANKFSYGIQDVWSNVMHKSGNMLLLERNFTYPHNNSDGSEYLNSNITDALPELVIDGVDIIIERVLESGGQVLYADKSILADYNHIALFHYY